MHNVHTSIYFKNIHGTNEPTFSRLVIKVFVHFLEDRFCQLFEDRGQYWTQVESVIDCNLNYVKSMVFLYINCQVYHVLHRQLWMLLAKLGCVIQTQFPIA